MGRVAKPPLAAVGFLTPAPESAKSSKTQIRPEQVILGSKLG
jgi:hypothetical protein